MPLNSSESEQRAPVNRIAITGSAGGIGRHLVQHLFGKFIVRGITRGTLPQESAAVLRGADVVLHTAVDTRSIRRDEFLAANRELDNFVLNHALKGNCKLFVYFSSMVVYAGTEPADEHGYREAQTLNTERSFDPYTQLKIEGEARVIQACCKAGVEYLILRPTIVTGPGLTWSDKLYKFFRRLPIGVRGALMNVIHVEDLCEQVDKLIASHARNEIFNLGGVTLESETFFTTVGRLTERSPWSLSRKLLSILGAAVPSTFWFFQKRVQINSDKLSAATGFTPERDLLSHFAPCLPLKNGRDLTAELMREQLKGSEFKTLGYGYSNWFNKTLAVALRPVSAKHHHGIVSLKGDLVTVRAGTRLSELSAFLERHGRTLATLPEFGGISCGACFFVDVHGSSTQHFSLFELIEEIRYLNPKGEIVVACRTDEDWTELRRRDRNFILLQVTFSTRRSCPLSNRLEWAEDADLEQIVLHRHRQNFSTTVQWFPVDKKLLVYNIKEERRSSRGAVPAFPPYRGLPYGLVKTFLNYRLDGRTTQVDRFHKILAPWTQIPLESVFKYLSQRPGSKVRDVELCMSLGDGLAFIAALRKAMPVGAIRFAPGQGIGIRYSYSEQEDRLYLWFEIVSSDSAVVDTFVSLARKTCDRIEFHKGKSLERAYDFETVSN